MHALVIDAVAGLTQLQVNQAGAVSPMPMRQLRRLTSTQPPGGVAPITRSYWYRSTWYRITQDTAQTHVELDGFGRPRSTVNNVGLKTRTVRDACGRVTFQSAPYTAGSGTRGVTTAYDPLGRVTSVTGPDGAVTTHSYTSGNDVTITDPLTRSTKFHYVAAGHPDGGQLDAVTDATNVTTWYLYDLAGQLTKVLQAGVPDRQWIYDSRGLLQEERQPESGTTLYQHDAAGNRTQVTNAKSEIVTFSYDGNNRLTGRDAPGTDADVVITYNTLGQVTSRQTPAGSTSFTYDTAGRVYTRTDTRGALTWTSTYGYDGRGNLTSITYPSTRLVTYEYDAENRLTTVRMNGALFASAFIYDDSGRLASYTTGGVTHTRTYDTADRPDAVRSLGAGSQGLDLDYTINAGGQVLQIADARAGMTQAFAYDGLDRLTGATGPWGQLDWAYDAAGNRLWERRGTVTSYAYDQPTQRLIGTTGGRTESFGYDNAGQLTSDGRGTYTYSPVGRMVTATTPTATAAYGYDADDLRVVRTVNGLATYTVRGAGGQVLSEYQQACAGTAWARDLVYAGGALIGAVRAASLGPTATMAAATVSVPESETSASVQVQLTTGGGPSGCAVTVHWEARPTTATAGADVVAAAGSVVFPAGSANGATLPVTLTLLPDTWDEDDETVVIALTSAVGGQIGATAGTTLTIVDDDPTPTLSLGDVTVAEPESGSASAVMTFTLSNPSGRTVRADASTANGTAVAGSDYTAASGPVVFEPGTTTQTFAVSVLPDTTPEPDETFTVALANVEAATPPAGPATVTIAANDQVAVTLTANRTFPIAAGTSVTFTAATTAGTPPYEYAFRLTQHGTGAERIMQGYFTIPTFTWVPAAPGSYTVEVRVRPVGTGIPYEALTSYGPFTITAAPAVTVTSYTANVTFPIGAGTTVTWSATATGGAGPLQYKFWAQDTAVGTWTVIRDYAPTPSAVWVAPKQGTYTFQVWVRSAGQTALYDTFDTRSNLTVTTSAPSIPFFTPDRPLPVPPGTTVTWTAQAGGTGPLEYAYWTKLGSGSFVLAQAYSPSPTFAWTPATAGTYTVDVGVRPVGSTAGWLARKSVTNVVVASGAIGSVGVAASQTFPVAVNTPVTWTGTATGGTAPLQYQFWLYETTSNTWTLVRDYSAERTWTWTPTATAFGQYIVQVRVRQTGSANPYDAYATSAYVTVTP